MHDVGRAGRDLVVVQSHEDVLRVAPIDAVTLPVDDEGVDEVRPGIHGVAHRVARAAAPDDAAAAADAHVHPHLVRIGRALGEDVAHAEGADHRLEQIRLAGHERRYLRAQRRQQLAVDPSPALDAEQIDAQRAVEESAVRGDRLVGVGQGVAQHVGERGVRRGKLVAQGLAHARATARTRREVGRVRYLDQRHVAALTVGHGLRRVVEAGHPVARDAAQPERVVVVLAAQPLVVVQFGRQVHLVAGTAELGAAVQRFEKRGLVELGLGLHQLAVDPAQRRPLAEGEGVVHGLVDGVVRVAPHAVDVNDAVADGAGDAGPCGGVAGQVVVRIVEPRIVEGSAEEGHRVVAAGAEARRPHASVPGHRDAPGLLHAEQVGGAVERARAMGAVQPALVDVRVALAAVVVVLQHLGRDEVARGGARQ